MKNVFIFGDSIAHGVGSERGGWADKLKVALHADMYGTDGAGEVCQIYELGVPGATMADLVGRFETDVHARLMKNVPEETYVIFSAGTNDSKAAGGPQKYDFTADDFAASAHAFIDLAKDYAAHIIGVGLTPVDESLTNPRKSPLSGKLSYFSNQRLKAFEQALRRTCDSQGVQFVPLFDQVPPDWGLTYLAKDGLHPNNQGHLWIRSKVEPVLRSVMGPLV